VPKEAPQPTPEPEVFRLPVWNDLSNDQRAALVRKAEHWSDAPEADMAAAMYAAIRETVLVSPPPLMALLSTPPDTRAASGGRDEVWRAALALCDDTEGTVHEDEFGQHYRVPKDAWDRLAAAIENDGGRDA